MTITSITTKKIRQYPVARSSMATYLRHSLPRLYSQIMKQTQFLDKFANEKRNVSIYERLYCIEHNLDDRPKCQKCKSKYVVKYLKDKDCYTKWCSPKCQASDDECIEKCKATRREKYGDENFNNKDQRSETLKKKACEDTSYWEKRVKKTKATKLKRHGSESYNNIEKIKETLHQRESEDSSFWKKREEKTKQTKISNGHDPNWNNREKAKETCKSNYGVEWFFSSNEWKEMHKQIVEDDPEFYAKQAKKRNITIASIPGFYERRSNKTSMTCLDKYGVSSCFQLEECRENRILADMQKKMQYLLECEYDKPMFSINALREHYSDKNYKYMFKCKKCGKTFLTTLKWSFAKHYHCPKCYPKSKSICEMQVLNYVISIWNDKNNVFFNDRSLIRPYELDIAAIDKKLKFAIEYDGLFWHSIDNTTYRKEKKISKNYHLEKLELCNKNGIQLIHIFEDEWLIDQNRTKARIAYAFGLASSIHDFQYQISIEKRKIVLYDKHTKATIAALSFSKSRFNIKEQWEILSFESIAKDSFAILLNVFEKTFNPQSIVFFIDRRWDNGNEYLKNGFVLNDILPPQCWWFNKAKLHRYHERFFKNIIAPGVLNEKFTGLDEQISKLNALGWMRIYDCGMLKFVKTYI